MFFLVTKTVAFLATHRMDQTTTYTKQKQIYLEVIVTHHSTISKTSDWILDSSDADIYEYQPLKWHFTMKVDEWNLIMIQFSIE